MNITPDEKMSEMLDTLEKMVRDTLSLRTAYRAQILIPKGEEDLRLGVNEHCLRHIQSALNEYNHHLNTIREIEELRQQVIDTAARREVLVGALARHVTYSDDELMAIRKQTDLETALIDIIKVRIEATLNRLADSITL